MSINMLPRLSLIILAALGTLAGLKLSVEHLQHGEVCPMLGPIPACIIVFLGYLCVVIAAVFVKKSLMILICLGLFKLTLKTAASQ